MAGSEWVKLELGTCMLVGSLAFGGCVRAFVCAVCWVGMGDRHGKDGLRI